MDSSESGTATELDDAGARVRAVAVRAVAAAIIVGAAVVVLACGSGHSVPRLEARAVLRGRAGRGFRAGIVVGLVGVATFLIGVFIRQPGRSCSPRSYGEAGSRLIARLVLVGAVVIGLGVLTMSLMTAIAIAPACTTRRLFSGRTEPGGDHLLPSCGLVCGGSLRWTIWRMAWASSPGSSA